MPNQITNFKDLNIQGIFNLFFISLYLFIDFVPFAPHFSMSEPQWYYLAIINVLTLIYLFSTKQFVIKELNFLSIVTIPIWSIVLFLCISALSLLNQINFFEGVITLSRYIIAFIAAFNLYFLFVNNKNLLYLTFSLISVLLLYQVLRAFGLLKTNLLQMTYAEMILAVKYNHSNKNIFSSVILLKLPLILYCSYLSTGYKKIFHMVSFTLALLLLFILSTRALMIGAVFMIAFFVITSAKHALTSKRLRIALISMVVVFSGIYSLINYTTRKQTVDKQSSALNGASMKLRFHFWEGALEEIKEKPVLGCGIGNWKIHTLKYESQWRTTTSVSVHAHNDFLQVTAESGLIAGLSFLLFFISLAYISFKNFKTTEDKSFKLLSVVLIMTTFGYCVDSFFNFPIARATPIVVLMLVSILIIVLSTTRDQEVQNKPYAFVIFGLIFFLGLGTIYPNYLQQQFNKGFNVLKLDEGKFKMSYDNINKLIPEYPNLDPGGSSVACMKANYLLKEGRYNEALKLVQKGIMDNPLSYYSHSMKALTFSKLKMNDSAFQYTGKLHRMMPYNHPFYDTYVKNLSYRKDSITILSTFKALDLKMVSASYFISTFNSLIVTGYDLKKSLAIVQRGQIIFPKDTMLSNFVLKAKKSLTSTEKSKLSETKSYPNGELEDAKLLQKYLILYQTNPEDYSNIQNIGVSYIRLREFAKALPYINKVVDAKALDDGKSQFMLAICYENLKEHDKACENARYALAKNYFPSQTKKLISVNCK